LAALAVELSDALVIADPAGVIVFWNHAAERRPRSTEAGSRIFSMLD